MYKNNRKEIKDVQIWPILVISLFKKDWNVEDKARGGPGMYFFPALQGKVLTSHTKVSRPFEIEISN